MLPLILLLLWLNYLSFHSDPDARNLTSSTSVEWDRGDRVLGETEKNSFSDLPDNRDTVG